MQVVISDRMSELTSSKDTDCTNKSNFHELNTEWVVYAHLPHDTDWSLKSYKTLLKTKYIEEFITLIESLPNEIMTNCMLFIMKSGIQPRWEDINNKNGGCFSYKVSNKMVVDIWKKMAYKLIIHNLLKPNVNDTINGITISPKKNFCIIKVWFKDCTNRNPETIDYFTGLTPFGCLFKKHIH